MSTPPTLDIDGLEARLGNLPPAYRAYCQARGVAALEAQGFDPKTLLVLNLELQQLEHLDGIDQRFFLTGDGCGNHYFVDLAGDLNKILLWAHDPPGIENAKLQVSGFLLDAEQTRRIDSPVEPGELWICRTPRHGESILDPISLDAWQAAVGSTEGLTYLGYREARNPFTRQVIRIEAPGHTIVDGHKHRFLAFFHGRARLDDIPELRSIAAELAGKLEAHVLDAS
jgi:hypothetical protein